MLFVAFAIGVGLCGLNLAGSADSTAHSVEADLSLAPAQSAAPTGASYASNINEATAASAIHNSAQPGFRGNVATPGKCGAHAGALATKMLAVGLN